MHAERKELKLQRLISEMHSQGANDDEDFEQDDDIMSAHESIWENEESGMIDPNEAQYSLKWKNHQNNMLDVFNRLLGNEQLTDVLIAVEGRKIRAHKVILSACSSYFENLFMTFDEKNQIVILKDASFIDVFALIEFIYKGEVNVGQDRLPSLLQTAESLRVKGLSESSTQDNTATANNENYRYKSSSSYGNVKYRRCDNPSVIKCKEEPFSPLQESSPFISTPKSSNLSTMDKLSTKFAFECKNSLGSGIGSKYINHSPKLSNLSSDKSLYATGTIDSSSKVGGLNTITQSAEHLKFSPGNGAVLPSLAGSCEQLKKKRGRPRILDSDSDVRSHLIDIDEDRTAWEIISQQSNVLTAFNLWSKYTQIKLGKALPLLNNKTFIKKTVLQDMWKKMGNAEKKKWKSRARTYRLSQENTEIDTSKSTKNIANSDTIGDSNEVKDIENQFQSKLVDNDKWNCQGNIEIIHPVSKNHQHVTNFYPDDHENTEIIESMPLKYENDILIVDINDSIQYEENSFLNHDACQSTEANFNIQGNEVADAISEPGGTESPLKNKSKNKMPTPGGPLTEERIKELGVIKMNDYLSSGTRPQFWEEYFVKVIMHAVNNNELMIKEAAALLGVPYAATYARYRELFGYRNEKLNKISKNQQPFSRSLNGDKRVTNTVSESNEIESLDVNLLQEAKNQAPGDDIANIDYDPANIAALNDVDMEDGDNYYISKNIATEVEINENTSKIAHNDTSKSSIKITKVQTTSNVDQKYYDQHNSNDEENGLPAPIVIAK